MKYVATVMDNVIVNTIAIRDADDPGIFGAVALPDGKGIGDRLNEEPTTEEILLELAADHEYRLSLQEMGLSESDLL